MVRYGSVLLCGWKD